MRERSMSCLYHIVNILSGLQVASISGLGAMLNYLAIVELWLLAIFWSCRAMGRWSFLVMWSYALLAIFWSCGAMGRWLFFGHVEL